MLNLTKSLSYLREHCQYNSCLVHVFLNTQLLFQYFFLTLIWSSSLTMRLTDIQTYRHTNIQTGKQTNRIRYIKTDRQKNIQKNIRTDKHRQTRESKRAGISITNIFCGEIIVNAGLDLLIELNLNDVCSRSKRFALSSSNMQQNMLCGSNSHSSS